MYYNEERNPDGSILWTGVTYAGRNYGYHVFYNEDGAINEEWSGYFLEGGWYHRISRHNTEGYCYIWRRTEV